MMFSRDKITRDEINAIKKTLKDRKKDIRDMIKLYKDMGKVINSNRGRINKNTTRIEGLLGTSAVKGLLRCDEPDRPDDATGLCPPPQEGAGRKKRKTRKRKGGLPECGMVENPHEWCKEQALSGNIEDNENTRCNLETGKCVKPRAVPRNFQSRQGR